MKEAILLFNCKDKPGIVASLSNLLSSFNANIISMDQFSTNHEHGRFFTRIVFCYKETKTSSFEEIKIKLTIISKEFNGLSQLFQKEKKCCFSILVSKDAHCLNELLHQWSCGQLNIDIKSIISNSPGHKDIVAHYLLPFHYIPATSNNRHEEALLDHVKNDTDGLILARYMQILSNEFLTKYKKDIINIHHSFLPSFKGANPYKQAKDYGVKVIGATSHFVTEDLDEGPIIMQDIAHVSHQDSIEDLKRKGRNLEQSVLAETIHLYSQHRILRNGNSTIVF